MNSKIKQKYNSDSEKKVYKPAGLLYTGIFSKDGALRTNFRVYLTNFKEVFFITSAKESLTSN